jgi:hypothetical protein
MAKQMAKQEDYIVHGWFWDIMNHAKANYGKDGWDSFVECMDLKDFWKDYDKNLFVDYASAFEYYRLWCKEHDEYRKDIYAEAF